MFRKGAICHDSLAHLTDGCGVHFIKVRVMCEQQQQANEWALEAIQDELYELMSVRHTRLIRSSISHWNPCASRGHVRFFHPVKAPISALAGLKPWL